MPSRSLLSGLLLASVGACAEQVGPGGREGSALAIDVEVFPNETDAAEFTLTARHAPLDQVLGQIARTTGITLHHSPTPGKRVTANCTGGVEVLLTCLLGADADMVFRHASAEDENLPAEVWILPLSTPAKTDRQDARITDGGTKNDSRQSFGGAKRTDVTDLLLERTLDPALRMEAIAELAVEGRKDDARVQRALRDALNDENPGVRMQAIFALARREGKGAIADLRQAMHDDNADVRMMAVDMADGDAELLQQALSDSDATVRQLAAGKLATLNGASTAEVEGGDSSTQ
jgi:hypothetical protein